MHLEFFVIRGAENKKSQGTFRILVTMCFVNKAHICIRIPYLTGTNSKHRCYKNSSLSEKLFIDRNSFMGTVCKTAS